MIVCPCGSQASFDTCCDTYLSAKETPKTPEALMRSRYTAYCLGNLEYIQQTMRGKALHGFDAERAKFWAKNIQFIGLQVLSSKQSGDTGLVSFMATYLDKRVLKTLQEVSEFQCIDGLWFYIDGKAPSKKLVIKTSLNGPCPCWSGKKFKNCHGL